jgi:ABC-type transporter Mla subunit MlaD
MEVRQIQKELTQVEQCIRRAAQAIETEQSPSSELRDWVKELDEQAKEARQAQDEQALAQCIEDMEAISDRAKAAVEKDANLGAQVKTAVQQAHQQLSDLKHRLH